MPNQSRRKWLRKNNLVWFALLVIVVFGGIVLARRFDLKRKQSEALQEISNISSEVKSPVPSAKSSATQVANFTDTRPSELNLAVPFTTQAPTGNWDHQHEENCEEASLLMASRYFANQKIVSTDDAEKGMAEIVTWENDNLKVSDSIDAEQTARVAREFLNITAEVIANPTADQIKQALFENKLVLVPAAGRELGNPFFTQPGPLYHMLVIKGYTTTKFITNDPGTKHGENYIYDFKTIIDANREWNGGDVLHGQHKMIVVSK